jgi:CHAD domain-containing protein
MAYRLKLKEPLVKGVRRVAAEQLANAAARLQDDSDPKTSVHEARKSLKRTRALLRLVRPGLGEARFRDLNMRLRDVARKLSAARDRDVVRALLLSLKDAKPSIAKAAARLVAILDSTSVNGSEASPPQRNFPEAVREIEAIRGETMEVELDPANFEAVVAGLIKSHRAGCRALARALEAPTEEEPLHDLRKSAQAYWRQMLLIQQAWPEACRARGAAAKRVADLLGRDHDVALLDALLAGPEGQMLTAAERRALTRYCASRHAELRSAALPKAQMLFSERSEDFGQRMSDLWDTARATAGSHSPVTLPEDRADVRKPS